MSLASLGSQLLARVRSLLLPLLAGVRTVSSAYQSQGTNRPQTSASSAAGAAAAFEVSARVVFPSLTSRIHLVSDAPRRRIKKSSWSARSRSSWRLESVSQVKHRSRLTGRHSSTAFSCPFTVPSPHACVDAEVHASRRTSLSCVNKWRIRRR